MQHYALANTDGAIQQTLTVPYFYVPCSEEVSDTTHYVDVATLAIEAKRPLEFELIKGGLTATLTGLPAGLTVETNYMAAITDDEELVITYDLPGTYEIRLSGHVEYLDKTLEVTVDDA